MMMECTREAEGKEIEVCFILKVHPLDFSDIKEYRL
jgi:hypothetical protein